jgi:hypothetical protein
MGTGDVYRSAKMAQFPNEYITVMNATGTMVSFSEGLYPNVTPSSRWVNVTAADFETMLKNYEYRFVRNVQVPVTQQPTPTPTPSTVTPRPLAIPHPEEPMNPLATLANTNVAAIITKWLVDWGVPAQHWDHWKTAIDIQVYDIYPPSLTAMGVNQDTPAATWEADGKRHLAIKPKWLNPGVIAHEQAHNSYALLNSSQKAAFTAVYTPLKNTDPVIKLLYSKNSYGLTNDIEGHAEVYRYIGQQMPAQLKMYYPELF